MNEPPPVTERDDGYVQDLASQWVADSVEARSGDRVLDLCAAPGGKATRLAADGAASWWPPTCARLATGLVVDNADRSGSRSSMVVADATAPPFRAGGFDAVLVDAPCSGLGALRRRPDARWRLEPADVDELAALQRRLLAAAPALGRARRPARLQRVHADGGRVDRPRVPDGFDVDRCRPRRRRGAPTARLRGCCPRTPTPTA